MPPADKTGAIPLTLNAPAHEVHRGVQHAGGVPWFPVHASPGPDGRRTLTAAERGGCLVERACAAPYAVAGFRMLPHLKSMYQNRRIGALRRVINSGGSNGEE